MIEKIHTSKAYEYELKTLKEKLVSIAHRVEKMLINSISAIVKNDVQLARLVIELDRNVDKEEILIDKLCLEILAKRQPLGQDLRFIVSVLKMVTYFERLGDLSVKICQKIEAIRPAKGNFDVGAIESMGKALQVMLHDTVEAFLLRDVDKATSVLKQDDAVDEIYHQCMKSYISKLGLNPQDAESYFHLLSVVKWLERIGDHCTNIAELVIFMVQGEDIRHKVLDQNDKWTSIVP